MTDKKDVISYGEYQKLPEEEKQNFETHFPDGKSGTATRKRAKIPEVKSTVPVYGMKAAEPDKTKTVLSKEEAAKAGIKTGKLPTQFELDHPILSGVGKVSDENGWIDDNGEVHTNSRATEARTKAVESGKTSSRYESDLKNGNFDAKDYKGNYVYSYEELVKMRDKYRAEGNKDLEKKLQAAINGRPEGKAEIAAKRKAGAKPAPKAQKVAESTGSQLTEVTTKEQEPESKTETEDPLKKAEELEQELEQKKYQTPVDIKKFSNDLNRFVIQAYLNGDFGKKSSPNAIATMGFFILDKIGAALVNASEVARGMSPSAKSQWGNILDKQTELLGKRITANWFLSLSREQQEALIRSGVISGTTAKTIYETVNTNAVGRAEQKDVLEISKLSQEQKGVAQSNFNALLARKSELQTLITQLKSDQGWEAYAQAMNAVVGTAKGLSSLGVTDDSSSSSNKGFSDTLSSKVSSGKVVSAFVSGEISNNSTWNNSSTEALSKSNSLNQDALALSKFKSGEDYAKATREAKKAANEQLIKRLEGQIEIIDKCIDSWGKDLGL